MNKDHAFDLLMAISARDQRTIGEADAAAWADDLADIALPEALDAVTAFHRSEFARQRRIKAADIVVWVQHQRRQRAEAEHSGRVVQDARALPPSASGRRPWRELWAELKPAAKAEAERRRESVLRYPDLCAALCDLPGGGFVEPRQWNGYVPPAGGRSARRDALVAIVEEAARRDAAGCSMDPA